MSKKQLALTGVAIAFIMLLIGISYLVYNRLKPANNLPIPAKDTITCHTINDCSWYTIIANTDNTQQDARILCGNYNYINSCENCSTGMSYQTGDICTCISGSCQVLEQQSRNQNISTPQSLPK